MGKKLVTYESKWETVKGYHLTIGIKEDNEFEYIFDDYETCIKVKNRIINSISSGNKQITYSHSGQHAVIPDCKLVTMGPWYCNYRAIKTVLVPNNKFEEDTIFSQEVLYICAQEKEYSKFFNYMYIDMTEEEIDEKVLQWHETKFEDGKEPKLYEYLGMTEKEYSDYVERFYIKVWKKSSK